MGDAYINTDLVLKAKKDLTALAGLIQGPGVEMLSASTLPDGIWYTVFETEEQLDSPQAAIEALLARLEASQAPAHRLWESCTTKEFDIGFERAEKSVSEFVLDIAVLGRMSRLGLSLRMTLYGNVPAHSDS